MAAETTHPAPLPPTPIEQDLPAVFTRAADIIVANGHYKGDYYNHVQGAAGGLPPKSCAVCAYGALNIAAGGGPEDINGVAALAALALADHLGIDSAPAAIGAWNDRPERTAEDVERVFREIAAELARGRTTTVPETDAGPSYPEPGSEIPDQPGYVVGRCGHRLAASEWRAGFETCERCPMPTAEETTPDE